MPIYNNMRLSSNISSGQISDAIEQWIVGRNAQRNRQITKRKLIDGITYEMLAEEFGLSVRQTKNIVYSCEQKIFSKT